MGVLVAVGSAVTVEEEPPIPMKEKKPDDDVEIGGVRLAATTELPWASNP